MRSTNLSIWQGGKQINFAKDTGYGDLFSLSDNDSSVSLNLQNIQANAQAEVISHEETVSLQSYFAQDEEEEEFFGYPVGPEDPNKEEKEAIQRYNDAVMDLGNLTQEFNYEDVLPNTDLEYIVSPGEIKENIVVNTPQENYSYNFDLNIEGLIPIQIDEHKIGLYEENIGYNKEQILEHYNTCESYDWFNSCLLYTSKESIIICIM